MPDIIDDDSTSSRANAIPLVASNLMKRGYIFRIPYEMHKKQKDSWEYELTFTYQDDADLDQQISDLLQEMDFQADLECCFIEADITEVGTDRSW